MKRMRNWFCLVMAMLLVLQAGCLSASAAETESPIRLTAQSSAALEQDLQVQIAAAKAMTDGKLVVEYDADKLTYVKSASGKAWPAEAVVLASENSAAPGKLILAFAADDAAAADVVFTLTFRTKAIGTARIALNAKESYITGAAAPSGSLEVTIGQSCDGGENCPTKDYTDLDHQGESHLAIDYMVEHGYMTGYTNTIFAPRDVMTRGMVVTLLYRVAGEPEVKESEPFLDVHAGDYFHNAVCWAKENGIAMGMTPEWFKPEEDVTREQMVTFLYRYAQKANWNPDQRAPLDVFRDAPEISDFAQIPMQWAVANGVIRGLTEDTIGPAEPVTREQTALMMYRILTTFAN